jgi:hypothetical protein
MRLAVDEFIRRFLIHVLPDGFHRIRHYGLFANGGRADNIARARHLLNVPTPQRALADADSGDSGPQALSHKYLTWTANNLLRQVVYEGLREDKPAREVRREVPHPKS